MSHNPLSHKELPAKIGENAYPPPGGNGNFASKRFPKAKYSATGHSYICAAYALPTSVLVGMHRVFTQVPPDRLRSTKAIR